MGELANPHAFCARAVIRVGESRSRGGFFGRDGPDSNGEKWGTKLVGVKQVHGNSCIEVPQTDLPKNTEGDALFTTQRGVWVGVRTADCVPVLVWCANNAGVAAVHAGWRGAVAGVTDSTIATFQRNGIALPQLRFAIGPAIAAESYEVDQQVHDAVRATGVTEAQWRALAHPTDVAGKWQFDLVGYVRWRLLRAGIATTAIQVFRADVHRLPSTFHSHRLQTQQALAGHPQPAGRQWSAIALHA